MTTEEPRSRDYLAIGAMGAKLQKWWRHLHGPRWWLERALLHKRLPADFVSIGGLCVRYDPGIPIDRRDAALAKIATALRMLYGRDGRRFCRLRTDKVTILLNHFAGGHSYIAPERIISLDLARLEEQKLEADVACSIVHEGAHARFASRGIPYNRRTAPRIERRCVEEEIAFVRKLPMVNEADRASWEARRRLGLESPWWGRRDFADRLSKSMAQAGFPPWVVRIYKFFGS